MSLESKLLSSKHAWLRRLGVSLSGRAEGPAAIGLLAEALRDENAGVRKRAARMLGRSVTGSRAVDWLRMGLADTDPGVRMESVRGLQRQRASQPLLMALSHEDADLRREAALALGRIGNAGAEIVGPLIERVRDHDPGVGRAALASLCRIGDIGACEPLLTLKETMLGEALARALDRTVARLRGWPQLDAQRRLLLWDALTEDHRLLTFSNQPTRGNAEKYCRRRLAEIDTGKGPCEAPGERTALEVALEDLTASGDDLVALQQEDQSLAERLSRGEYQSPRERARHEAVKALLTLANGTGQYNPSTVTLAMLPVLCCVGR
jgi:HEAT repeat protein